MKLHKLAAIALVIMLMTAGVAAATPADDGGNEHTQADDTQQDEADRSEDAGENATIENASSQVDNDAMDDVAPVSAGSADPRATSANDETSAVADALAKDASDRIRGVAPEHAGGPSNAPARQAEQSKDSAAAQREASENNAPGPGEDVPSQTPDHVSRIHETIRDFLSGNVDGSLGNAISGLFSDKPSEEASSADS